MIKTLIVAGVALTAFTAAAQAESDFVGQASMLPCPVLTRENLSSDQWLKGGAPDASPDAPFGIPLASWSPSVWQALRERAISCNRDVHRDSFTDEANVIGFMVKSTQGEVETRIAEAVEANRAREAKKALVLSKVKEAAMMASSADNLSVKIEGIRRLVAAPPELDKGDLAELAAAIVPLEEKVRTAQLAEADAWDKSKSERDAKAAEASRRAAEDERIAKFRREKAESDATERANAESAARREQKSREEAEQAASNRYRAETTNRTAQEKIEKEREESARLNAACPIIKKKDDYYKNRLIRQDSLATDLRNNPENYLDNPQKACGIINDRISIFSEMKEDISSCLGSDDPGVKKMVENLTGLLFAMKSQKSSSGCR